MVCRRTRIFNKTPVDLRDGLRIRNGNGPMIMVEFQRSYYHIHYF